MTCDRFHLLQQFFHFNCKANSSYDPNDGKRGCCHPVCLFIDMKLCRKLYYPEKQLSVCKSLALFKCQLHFKQYIKTKRVCFGMKFYKLTSSNCAALNFSVKAGKECLIMGMRIVICRHEKEPLFINHFFSLTGNT